jgi:hypothetical protein
LGCFWVRKAAAAATPWLNAITYGHADKPDFAVRGNIPGSDSAFNGWPALRRWRIWRWGSWQTAVSPPPVWTLL